MPTLIPTKKDEEFYHSSSFSYYFFIIKLFFLFYYQYYHSRGRSEGCHRSCNDKCHNRRKRNNSARFGFLLCGSCLKITAALTFALFCKNSVICFCLLPLNTCCLESSVPNVCCTFIEAAAIYLYSCCNK